jgi:hypothetical protein
MTDTPETDAAWTAESGNGLNEVRDLSRKIERERDTACRLLAQMHAAAVGDIQGPDIDSVTDIINLRKERDEWRECAKKCASAINAKQDSIVVEALCEFGRLMGGTKK